MLKQIQSAEASLVNTLKQAAASLNAVGTAELAAAVADLERAASEAKARLTAAADRARGLFLALASDVGPLGAQLAADLFAPVAPTVPEAPAETTPVAAAPAVAQDASAPEAGPTPAAEASRPASDAAARQAEQVVCVAANSPVEVDHVEDTAQLVEALQGQAGDGATREEVEAGLDALALEQWHKRDLLALARRLSRDVAGRPSKAELIHGIRTAVLDVREVCAFNN